ncbi:MAG: hypothetical protein KJ621_19015, partial [Proteobacteria bacterium]|nr:hypothetical protein [Pseudomonadota bacterium]
MTTPTRRPFFAATSLTMVPYRDIETTARTILANMPEAPFLPVMTRSYRWLLEGFPCLVIDSDKKLVMMAPPEEREAEVLEFYDRVEQDDLDHFATTPRTAPFYEAMLEEISRADTPDLKWLAVQIPGPVVLADSWRQMDGKPCFHHETLRDMVKKTVALKTRWLERRIKEALPGVEVIADHPEPTLVGFTSALGGGSRHDLIGAIEEGFAGVTGLRWVHCCANIDWSLLIEADIDVINFDAFAYADKVALYAEGLKTFLERGGTIGWGIVPVEPETLRNQTLDTLVDRLQNGIDLLTAQGLDEARLAAASWVLPSCEPALLSPELADRAFSLTRHVSEAMR